MLFHCICEPICSLILPVQLDSLVKPPVVGKTNDSCMLEKRGSLGVVGVKFVSVGLVDQHENQSVVLMRVLKDIRIQRGIKIGTR